MSLSNQTGIWIDHRRAVIVKLTHDGDTVTTLESSVEKHLERGGDSPLQGPYEARQVPADDSRQRALTGGLNAYYDRVIAGLSNHESLLIFGPGEAKGELHQRLTTLKPQVAVTAVETEDKMTEHQIVAKTRAHFGSTAPRVQPPA